MKGYTTKAKIENYLLINIDATFDSQIDAWIEEIEEYIDRKTGRNFVASPAEDDSGENETRRFDGDNTIKLLIDDAVEISEIKLSADSDPLTTDDYVLYPANARTLSRKVPYTMIKLVGAYFPNALPQGIYVKGRWGYSETPPMDIQTVATVLVAGIINYSWNADGEIASETIGRYTVSYKNEKQWQDFDRIDPILQSYVKFGF